MGIKGLESFLTNTYNQSKDRSNSPFVTTELKNLKLIVDGNQLPYHISEILNTNQHGGNYDQLYHKIRVVFQILKPFIEVVIFDGSKEDLEKATERFSKNVLSTAQANSNYDLIDLKKTPPLFFRTVMYKVLRELDIMHFMSDGMADHAIACYANGFNDNGTFGTVLSMDSDFYAYNLKNGYLSFKYFTPLLGNLNKLKGSTKVPVFYVSRLMEIVEIKNFQTWLYFCILLGESDINLSLNTIYMSKNSLKNKIDLINHLQTNENKFIDEGYKRIRDEYNNYSLKLIDELFLKFEFKNSKYTTKFSSKNSEKFDDFDRIILTLRDIKTIFLHSIIEDTSENHCYQICQKHQILEQIYSFVSSAAITEYSRLTNPVFNRCVSQIRYSDKKKRPNDILDYIDRVDKDAEADSIELLLISLSVWFDWINTNRYQNKLNADNNHFIDTIFYNYIILKLKNLILNKSCKQQMQASQDCYIKILRKKFDQNANDYRKIVELYDHITANASKTNEQFFKQDLMFVHRFSEFQCLYYMIGVYCKLKSITKLNWLSPDEFLNGLFFCKFVQESNKINTKSHELINLLVKNEQIDKAINKFADQFNKCLNSIIKYN
jgi:hypothetical protein